MVFYITALPEDMFSHISSYLYWYESMAFSIVNKRLFENVKWTRNNILRGLSLLRKNVEMACHDHPKFAAQTAMVWGETVVNYYYANPPEIQVGNICDGKDYLDAWSVCTIIGKRTNTGGVMHRYTFAPLAPRALEDTMECGEMHLYKPCYTEYLVHFHGWSSKWNEWLTIDNLAPLGTYTFNPWSGNVYYSRQWMIQKKRIGGYDLQIKTVRDFPRNAYPPTNILIQCMVRKPRNAYYYRKDTI